MELLDFQKAQQLQQSFLAEILCTKKGGWICLINNCKVFLPGSQLFDETKGYNFFERQVGKTFPVVVISVNGSRVIVSHLKYKQQKEYRSKILHQLSISHKSLATIIDISDKGYHVLVWGIMGYMYKNECTVDDIRIGETINVAVSKIVIEKQQLYVSNRLYINLVKQEEKVTAFEKEIPLLKELFVGKSLKGVVMAKLKDGYLLKIPNGLKAKLQNDEIPYSYKINIDDMVECVIMSINQNKHYIYLSINKFLESKKYKIKNYLESNVGVNNKVLEGRVVFLERNITTISILIQNEIIYGYIKNEDLAWEKVQNASDFVFLGEELKVKYLYFEKGKPYFDLKWQLCDLYPKELFEYSTEELLSDLNIYDNKVIAKVHKVTKQNKSDGNEEILYAFVTNIVSLNSVDAQFIDKYTGKNLTAILSMRYAYGLQNGNYYKFVLTASSPQKRREEHRPYMFIAELEGGAIPMPDPFKSQVEKSFKENKTPKSNRELAKNIKEFGADMYSDRDRMFYELLQNADDASSVRGVKVMVQIKNNYLIFTHDGLSFSRQDFRAIVSTANSTKRLDRKKTGYKGIGFKSVFTDSEKVYIKTGGFFFAFNKESYLFKDFRKFYTYVNPLYTEEQLKVFFEENAEYEEEFEQVDHLPWQILPFWIENVPESLKGTTFCRNCNVAIALDMGVAAEKYKETIKGIIEKPRFMLFLRNTLRIQLEEDEVVINEDCPKWSILSIAKQVNMDNNIVTLKNSFANSENEVSYIVREGSNVSVTNEEFKISNIPMIKECKQITGREKWFLYQIVDDMKIPITSIPERIIAADTTTLSYAFMLDNQGSVTCIPNKTPALYAFLPMEDRRYLFPFFINADFELSSNRQEAKRVSVWNEFLFYNIGKNIISWVATLASIAHPCYLTLLPNEFFTEDLEESKVDRLAFQFNRGYRESLIATPFLLNDKEEVVCQSDLFIDESGFASIIGADDFCSLYNSTKRLLHHKIDAQPLKNLNIFSEIEHVPSSDVINHILSKTNRTSILRYWISISLDLRFTLLTHISEMPGNRKNLDAYLADIPAYTSCGKIFSYNKLLRSKRVILRSNLVKSIEDILLKLGFKLTNEIEEVHPFYSKLKEISTAYTVHLFDVVAERTLSFNSVLSTQDKAKLFLHFSTKKIYVKVDDLSTWNLFCNQAGAVTPLSGLTRIDSILYNNITNQYVIDENEYLAIGKTIDRYLMKEKDQFDRILVGNWESLVNVVGQDYIKVKSLYQLALTTYMVAEHEQAEEKNCSPLCDKKCVFASDKMREITDTIVNSTIADDESLISIIQKLTGKYIPNAETIKSITEAPFGFKQQKVEDMNFVEDEILSINQVCSLLDCCAKTNDTIFKKYCISQTDVGFSFKKLTSNQCVAYTNNNALKSFIESNCSDIILLQEDFVAYKNIRGILIEENLLFKVLETIRDVKNYAHSLLPIYENAVSSVKTALLCNISSIELNENSFTENSDINIQLLSIASTIEKQDKALFDNLRSKINITFNGITYVLSSIKLQHTIEVSGQKFPLSKLMPNEDKVAIFVDSLKERLEENNLSQIFIDKLFDEEVDEGRASEVFFALNRSNVILENGVQLAFMLKYSDNLKQKISVLCKVRDNCNAPQCHPISQQWFVNGSTFMDYGHVLNTQYVDSARYLSIPFKSEKLGCFIKKDFDNYSFVKEILTKEEISDLLNYVLKSYENGTNLTTEDIKYIKDRVGIKDIEYVISTNYCLPAEELPVYVEEWRKSSNASKKNALLKDVFGVNTEDSNIVKVRKFLSEKTPLSVSPDGRNLSQLTCRWIKEKALFLDNVQFTTIIDVLNDNDFCCKLNRNKLAEYANSSYRHMVFGEYYLYLYDGEMPWNACLKESDYIFHTYKENDIVLDGYNIFVNKSKIHSLPDLIRSIVNINGFTTQDFLNFFDKYNASISGTLDGENDEDLDEDSRTAANQLAKQEAIEWLSSKGYDTSHVQINFSFLEGVCKENTIYHIVVKSFRSSLKELKINPNEWLYLLKPNSRLMLYIGHMSFAVIDRKTLLGNHDFLKLRISSSNFRVGGNKLEENLERLAHDIQCFERTHFVFERIHDNILSRANSLEDYGLFKSNSSQKYSASKEEDIE